MRRNGARFALISVGKIGHEALLLRLSTVLRNAVVMCDSLITPGNCWRKTTWPEFQPSLPPGRVREVYAQGEPIYIMQRASSVPGRSILLALSDFPQGARDACAGNILALSVRGMLSQPEVIG